MKIIRFFSVLLFMFHVSFLSIAGDVNWSAQWIMHPAVQPQEYFSEELSEWLLMKDREMATSAEVPHKYDLRSPEGNILVQVSMAESEICYRVYLDDSLVVNDSPLGIALKGAGYDFISGLQITGVQYEAVRDTFRLTTGKRKQCYLHANQLTFQVKNECGNKMQLIFRASNDGIGFRYILKNEETDTLFKEVSGFSLPSGTIAWAMDYRSDNEGFYLRNLTDTMQQNMYVMPMLCQVPSRKFVLIHEADVMHRYAAGSLHRSDSNGLFSVVTYYPPYRHYASNYRDTYEAVLEKERSEIIAEPYLATPWRVLIMGSTLKPIVESTFIEALCPPPTAGDYSWATPGVTVFPWWGNNLANGDTNALKSYIDLAAIMNWKFIEFDVSLIGSGGFATEQWRTTPWIKRVVDYAGSKNISVYGWDERRNLDTPEKREDIFGKYHDYGIKGIKIDFINSVKQDAMAFREACLNDALKHKLLVSFHGDYPPRGERRTYPNIATQEGVKGSEYYLFASDNEIPTPEHNCTLPFTRNVIGPMDYTPVAFSHPRRVTTYAHELALSVVVESGWLCMCDKPEYYINSPAIGFLKRLVSVWDETIFLDGYPGEYFCIARRNGNDWYVAGINAGKERKLSLNLDFLRESVSGVTIYYDGENAREKCSLTKITCSPDQPLNIGMAANGGFALIIPGK